MKAKTGVAAQAVVNIATPPATLQPTISEAAPPARTEPVTRTVDATGLGQHTSVSEAISAANPGERILIRPGIYKEELIVDKPLELVGDGEVEKIQIVSSSRTTLEFRTTSGRVSNLSVIFDGTAEGLGAVKISQGRLILEKCAILASNGYGVVIGPGASPQILNNRIESRKTGILGTGSRFLAEHNDIVLHGDNSVGVSLEATEDAVIRANHIQGGTVGIVVRDGATGSIEGNRISGCFFGVMVLEPSKFSFTRNSIVECSVGIKQLGGTASISGNLIQKSRFAGIDLTLDAKASIEGNTITDNGRGIDLAPNATAEIGKNEFSGNAEGDVIRREDKEGKLAKKKSVKSNH